MPIYEYKCEHCGEKFEVLQKVKDQPLTECIRCSEGPVKKLISASAFVLKGTGFYVNDYPSSDRKVGMNSEKTSSSTTVSSTSSDSSSSKKETAKKTPTTA